MQLSQVEGINAFFCTHQYVLIPSLWVNPRCSAIDLQRTAIENLKSVQKRVVKNPMLFLNFNEENLTNTVVTG